MLLKIITIRRSVLSKIETKGIARGKIRIHLFRTGEKKKKKKKIIKKFL